MLANFESKAGAESAGQIIITRVKRITIAEAERVPGHDLADCQVCTHPEDVVGKILARAGCLEPLANAGAADDEKRVVDPQAVADRPFEIVGGRLLEDALE